MNNDPTNHDIMPRVLCREITRWFDELPPKEELTEDHALILMAIENHLLETEHEDTCFAKRQIH